MDDIFFIVPIDLGDEDEDLVEIALLSIKEYIVLNKKLNMTIELENWGELKELYILLLI